jgi:hypothetical protein
MRLQEISRWPGDGRGTAGVIRIYSVLVKAETPLLVDGKKVFVMCSATALPFSHAKYSPHYPYPYPHRSFPRLGL